MFNSGSCCYGHWPERTSWQEASEFPLQSYSTRPVLPRHLLNTYCMLSSGGRKGSCGLGLETTRQAPVLLAPFPHSEIMTGTHCHSTGWGCEQKHSHKTYRLSVLSLEDLLQSAGSLRRLPWKPVPYNTGQARRPSEGRQTGAGCMRGPSQVT